MVIFFDIDGTLVDEATQIIPASTVAAITALGQRGHTCIVNTGRPYSHVDPRVRALPFAGWVCSGGMEVRLDGQWLQKKRMNRQLSQYVIDQVRAHNMQVLLEVEGGFLVDGRLSTCPQVVHEARRLEEKGCFVRQVADQPEPILIKFVSYDGPDSLHEEFVEKMRPWFHCIDRGGTMMEYVLLGCSKAAGLQRMVDALGEAKENTYAFGDSTNDVTMFRVAGHAICMGNGMDEAKAEAEFVTDTVLEDGIEKALRHYGLI